MKRLYLDKHMKEIFSESTTNSRILDSIYSGLNMNSVAKKNIRVDIISLLYTKKHVLLNDDLINKLWYLGDLFSIYDFLCQYKIHMLWEDILMEVILQIPNIYYLNNISYWVPYVKKCNAKYKEYIKLRTNIIKGILLSTTPESNSFFVDYGLNIILEYIN